jgi:hypothetical protein
VYKAARQPKSIRYGLSPKIQASTKTAFVLRQARSTTTLVSCWQRKISMLDFIDIVAMVFVFALGIAYLYGCERLKGKRS